MRILSNGKRRNTTGPITRQYGMVPRPLRPLAVVTGDEKLAIRDCDIYLARGVSLGAVSIGAPFSIIYEAVWILVVVDGHSAIFNGDALAREGNDALDDILIANIGRKIASHGVLYACGFVLGYFGLVFVHKDDDLPALGDVLLANKMSPRYGGAIDYDAVVAVEGVFHAAANDIV